MKDFLRETDAFFRSRMPDVTRRLFYALALSFLAIRLLMAIGASGIPYVSEAMTRIFLLTPSQAVMQGHVWQFVTYAFAHIDFLHFFFNILALYFMGPLIEEKMGSRRFGWFVFGAIIAAGFAHTALALMIGKPVIALLGFSGVIFALLVAAFVWYPTMTVYFIFIPMPMRLFCAFFGAVMLFGVAEDFARFGPLGGSTSHLAHLAGIFVGFLMIRWPQILDYLETVSIPYILPKRRRPASIVNMGHPGRHSDPDDRYNDPHWRLDQ